MRNAPTKRPAHSRVQACTDKKTYPRQTDAINALRHITARRTDVKAYKCVVCRQYHLANRTPRVLRLLDQIAAGGGVA